MDGNRYPGLGKDRNSVTSLNITPTSSGPKTDNAAAEQLAMTNGNNSSGRDDDIGTDPIAAALRQLHDAVASEALPEEFLRLLDEIDTSIAANKAAN